MLLNEDEFKDLNLKRIRERMSYFWKKLAETNDPSKVKDLGFALSELIKELEVTLRK